MVSSNARFFRPSQKGPHPGAAMLKFWYIIFQYARPILRPLLVRRSAFTGNHFGKKNDPGSRGHLVTWNFRTEAESRLRSREVRWTDQTMQRATSPLRIMVSA